MSLVHRIPSLRSQSSTAQNDFNDNSNQYREHVLIETQRKEENPALPTRINEDHHLKRTQRSYLDAETAKRTALGSKRETSVNKSRHFFVGAIPCVGPSMIYESEDNDSTITDRRMENMPAK
jgi:hypothetical protein